MDIIETISAVLNIKSDLVQLAAIVLGFIFLALVFVFLIGLIVYIFKLPGKKNKALKAQASGKDPLPRQKTSDAPERGEQAVNSSVSQETGQIPGREPAETSAATAAFTPSADTAPAAESIPTDAELQDTVDRLAARKAAKVAVKAESASNTPQKPQSARQKLNSRASARSLQKKASKLKIPKSVQDSIPYYRVYSDSGIIEVEPGKFTKSYLLEDVNYQVAKDAEQAEMFMKYGEFLNAFDPTCRVQITVNQRNINMEEFEEETMLPMRGDNLDPLREERNQLLKNKILEGRNNLVMEKYATICVQAPDYEAAKTVFLRMDSTIVANIKKIGGAEASALSTTQRLEILHDIYNLGDEGMFGNNMTMGADGNLVFAKDKFSFDIMRRMGLTTKDMIAPESLSFKSDYGMIGDKYFRALFLRKLPSFLADNVLAELTDTDCNMLTSLVFEPVEGEKAVKLARAQIRNINANVVEKQKQASKNGYSTDLISPELRDASEEANQLFSDLTSKNQKLFYLTLAIVHFAETKEKLDSDTKLIQTIGRRLLVDIKKLSWQQENGLATALPLCNNQLQIKRSLTTESASVFMPFVNQELNDRDGGLYYGNNAVSQNLIRLNRRNSSNGNGFILGKSGAGKGVSAKQEMMDVLLSSNDDVIVIDPDGEYKPMADMLGGEVVRIAPGTDVHINPFDITMNLDKDDDPISIKSDFIVSMCEAACGDRYGLNASQRSLIDRCVRAVYKPFLESRDPVTGEYDNDKIPTLVDFYEELRKQTGYDAMQLADGLEMFVLGSQNVFAYRTNVDYSNRFVVYDIKKLGEAMKSMGLMIVLDNVWNRIAKGRKEGRNVWFYIDEVYLLFRTQSSARFLQDLYRRARKYGGMPTSITQNVTELLENDVARTMISNSDFILMLNQAPPDRVTLSQLLNISPTQMSYITNSNPGEGLLYDGVHLVPFVNKVPKDTMQYKAMTTKLSEVQGKEGQETQEEQPGEQTPA